MKYNEFEAFLDNPAYYLDDAHSRSEICEYVFEMPIDLLIKDINGLRQQADGCMKKSYMLSELADLLDAVKVARRSEIRENGYYDHDA